MSQPTMDGLKAIEDPQSTPHIPQPLSFTSLVLLNNVRTCIHVHVHVTASLHILIKGTKL